MRALLLAGGYGKRLSPLSNLFPKCMMPINGRPLLDIWLENLLSSSKIEKVLINTHAKSDFVTEYLLNSSWKDHIKIVHEEKLLGTAGTIYANKNFFKDKEFFVAHADNLSIFDMNDFVETFKMRRDNILLTMMLFRCDDPSLCGVVELNNHNEVIQFHEKSQDVTENLANAAIFIFDTRIFEIIEDINKKEIDISLDLIPLIINRINCYENKNFHIDIGNVLNWNIANLEWPKAENQFINNEVWKELLKKYFL